ncbi:hypothetical protein FEM48_Zijuj01G0139400 [Ziziphus jujuba var. spinosa]|uniref:Apple domain-containing protein n=1 Tax=Ziziphus jujuba var. spinosa TaxID=714518 RepID=A0A978W1N6_ZIZJJ|nr:hypothetical protein FEM48_Zijuj01G0139400 [Ziziphus jujuba var. spinosa]
MADHSGRATLSNEEEDESRYFTYTPLNVSDKMMFRIRWDGFEEQLRWEEGNKKWSVMQSQPDKNNDCELYNKCGNFAICSSWESPICSCMQGFVPKNWEEWRRGKWEEGCYRRTPLLCQRNSTGTQEGGDEDGFASVKCAKLPDFGDLVRVDNTDNCKGKCSSDCNCTAYSYVNGIGCLIWSGELLDVQHFTKGGNTLYIRLAHSDLGGKKSLSTVLIVTITIVGAVFLGLFICLAWRFKSKLKVLPSTATSTTTTSLGWRRSNEIPPYDASKSAEISTELSGPVDLGIEGNQVNGPDLPIGYMAPEYAMEGLFSVKSDVYSFGVLLLEIVSGRRNISYRSTEYASLLAYNYPYRCIAVNLDVSMQRSAP